MKRSAFRSSGKGRRYTAVEKRAMVAYREAHQVCEACHRQLTSEIHHIVTYGTQGPTEDWNLLALCAFCHNGVHGSGWLVFLDHYPQLAGKMTEARIRMGRKTT